MSDLTSLMQVSPYAAAWLIGDKHATDRRTDTLRQQELAGLMNIRRGQEARSQALHPYELEAKQLANQKTREADIPYLIQQIEETRLKNDGTRRTQDSAVAAANFKNEQEPQKAFGAAMGEIGRELQGKAPHEIEPLFRKGMESRGIKGQYADAIWQRFANVPPDQISQRLIDAHQRSLVQTPGYEQEKLKGANDMAEIQERNRGSERVANISAAAQRYSADARSKGLDIDVLDQSERAILTSLRAETKGKPPATQLAVLNQVIATLEDGPLKERLIKRADAVAKTIQSLPSSQPRPGQVDPSKLGSTPLPTTPVAEPYVAGRKAPPPVNDSALRSRVEAAGEKYEPDKYKYRIAPNGELQRAPK